MVEEKIGKLNPKTFINSFNPQEEYRILKKKAKHGFVLTKIDEDKYTFSKIFNQDPLYFIDYFSSANLGDNQYLSSKIDMGWRYLGSVQDWYYFIAKEGEFPERIYSNFQPYIRKVRKSLIIPVLSLVVISLIYVSLDGTFGDHWWSIGNRIFTLAFNVGLAVFAYQIFRRLTILGYLRNPIIEDQALYTD